MSKRPSPVQSRLDAARAGSASAWEALFREHHSALVRFVRAYAPGLDAADLAAETFTRAIEQIDRFHGDERGLQAWLFRTARNLAIDAGRKGRRAVHVAEVPEDSRLAPAADELAGDPVANQAVIDALATLPERHRAVLWLRLVEGLPAEEVGDALGLRANAVRQLQFRAFAGLKAELGRKDSTDGVRRAG